MAARNMGGNGNKESESARFEQRMRRKADRIRALEVHVLETKERVDAAARRQLRDKQSFLSGNFLKTWRTGFDYVKASDQRNRPSDQQLPVRSYSRVDNEVWQMPEMRRWFDAHSSPQAGEGLDPLVSGYTTSGDKSDELPPLMRTQRLPTPPWVVAEERAALEAAQSKLQNAKSLNELKDRHFSDFEGNLKVQRARTAVLASRLQPPKGWGAHHTHVANRPSRPRGLRALMMQGFRTPPWKARPPQDAPQYQSPRTLKKRDMFIQAGGGLEAYSATRAATRLRTVAMQAGSANGEFGPRN